MEFYENPTTYGQGSKEMSDGERMSLDKDLWAYLDGRCLHNHRRLGEIVY
jgi:hypothetical protein